MGRKEITAMLSAALERYIDEYNDPRIYWAREVTFDYGSLHQTRVDYMQFKPVNNTVSGIEKGDFFCYEIKSSKADFDSKNGHNFLGDYNYYVMPESLFSEVHETLPANVGVLVPDGDGSLMPVKRAKQVSRSRPVSEMLLMMWRSSRREIVNIRRAEAKEERVPASGLKPCPFCGGEAKIQHVNDDFAVAVVCQKCGARTVEGSDVLGTDALEDKWNARTIRRRGDE